MLEPGDVVAGQHDGQRLIGRVVSTSHGVQIVPFSDRGGKRAAAVTVHDWTFIRKSEEEWSRELREADRRRLEHGRGR